MKAHDLKGNEIDENNLTDTQSLMLDKIANLELPELEAHGAYFIWGTIPESGKTVTKKFMPRNEYWLALINNLNGIISAMSGGELEVVIRAKDIDKG